MGKGLQPGPFVRSTWLGQAMRVVQGLPLNHMTYHYLNSVVCSNRLQLQDIRLAGACANPAAKVPEIAPSLTTPPPPPAAADHCNALECMVCDVLV